MVPCEKSKTVLFASSVMKSIVAPTSWAKFLVQLICCIASGSASSVCCFT